MGGIMLWVEIIELRSVGGNLTLLKSQLQSLIKEVNKGAELQAIKIYKHAVLENDFNIHLFHDSKNVDVYGSPLGLQQVSGLTEFGLVNHTIWVEAHNST